MAQATGVSLKQKTRITEITQNQNSLWELTILEPLSLFQCQTAFVIDATGRSSWLARKLNIKADKYDNLLAFIAFYSRSEQTQD